MTGFCGECGKRCIKINGTADSCVKLGRLRRGDYWQQQIRRDTLLLTRRLDTEIVDPGALGNQIDGVLGWHSRRQVAAPESLTVSQRLTGCVGEGGAPGDRDMDTGIE